MIFSPHEHFDNTAAANVHIDVRPIAAAMGAEIAGVDCAHLPTAASIGTDRWLASIARQGLEQTG